MPSAEETFRRLTIGDSVLLAAIADLDERGPAVPRLDERTEALIRVGALVALDAPQSSYHAAVEAAQLAGVSLEDLLAALVAVAGSVGSARVVSAAPRIPRGRTKAALGARLRLPLMAPLGGRSAKWAGSEAVSGLSP